MKGGSSLEESLVGSFVSMMTNGQFGTLCAVVRYICQHLQGWTKLH